MLGFFTFVGVLLVSSAQELLVQLPDGKVQGTTLNTPNGKSFYTWRHILYAKPPVDLCFKAPIKPDLWTDILDGSKDSKACHSVGTNNGYLEPTYGYSEDCLYINVYSPEKPEANTQELLVQLPDGKVQGTTLNTPNGKSFYTWRHIPYAKPSVGDLRFKAPVKPDPWTDILDGSKDSKSCHSVGTNDGYPEPTYGYSEDCLYINVYSPEKPEANLNLPVMFWIYGGGFFTGTADFAFTDPSEFMQESVIIVTFNYRLSVFGFLSTNDEVVPGNSGLKDQLAALTWARDNIALFGGNPQDITIFGESAGAMSAGYHLVSPKSKNLFNGAIMQSCSCLFNFIQTDARDNAVNLARHIDDSITQSSSSQDILKVLQSVDENFLVDLTKDVEDVLTEFRTVLEVNHPDAFLTEPFYETIEAGNITRVPIIIGTNSEEEILLVSDLKTGLDLAESYENGTNLMIPNFKLKNGVSEEFISQAVKEVYIGKGSFTDNLGGLVRFLSDNTFVRPAIKHAVLQSKHTPVYFYRFSYVGTFSKDNFDLPGCGRVGHAEDVPYLFNITTKPLETEEDFLTRRRLVKMWTNFAKTKNPTPNDDSANLLQHVSWAPFNSIELQYLDIGENLEIKFQREADTTPFWDYLWETYSYRPYNTF